MDERTVIRSSKVIKVGTNRTIIDQPPCIHDLLLEKDRNGQTAWHLVAENGKKSGFAETGGLGWTSASKPQR
jgi:hypothetical protein